MSYPKPIRSDDLGTELRVAATGGMEEEARQALERLQELAASERVGVAGKFMPDSGVSLKLARLGVREEVEEEDFFRFSKIVIPYPGISQRLRKRWLEAGHALLDLSSPHVRRAQVALGLLRMEGAQPLVIGRHEDAESLAIAGGYPGTVILEETTDTARLAFAPAFGVVCQTRLSPRRIDWLVQQLRMRYRDARVTFLNTSSPAMAAREQALEELLGWCDRVVIVGQPGESSCEALAEAALRHNRPSLVVASAEEPGLKNFVKQGKVALSAGAFALLESIRGVAKAISAG